MGSDLKEEERAWDGFEKERGRFSIRIEGQFTAAHALYNYFPDGSDEATHNHKWIAEVTLSRLDGGAGEDGISVDFIPVRNRLDNILSRLDKTRLNDLSFFRNINPTAENVARWIYRGIKHSCEDRAARIESVRVFEGENNSAIFFP